MASCSILNFESADRDYDVYFSTVILYTTIQYNTVQYNTYDHSELSLRETYFFIWSFPYYFSLSFPPFRLYTEQMDA